MLAYCDYIAHAIRGALTEDSKNGMSWISNVMPVKMDLHPEKGYMLTTKKTLEVVDSNGKKYLVTVEEV